MKKQGYVFQIFQDAKRDWRWRLKSGNRRIVAQSEGYTRKGDAIRSAEKLACDGLWLEAAAVVVV